MPYQEDDDEDDNGLATYSYAEGDEPPVGALRSYAMSPPDEDAADVYAEARGASQPGGFDESVRRLYNLSDSILGPGTNIQGELARKRQALSDSNSGVKERIIQARKLLEAAGSPIRGGALTAYSQGLMQPGLSFEQSVANASANMDAYRRRERDFQLRQAQDLGQLGVREAQVGRADAAEQVGYLDRDLVLKRNLEERAAITDANYARVFQSGVNARTQADSREKVKQLELASKDATTRLMLGNKLTVAEINANKSRFSLASGANGAYVFDKGSGLVADAPPGVLAPGSRPTAQMTDAEALYRNGTFPDISSAYAYVRSGVNTVRDYNAAVERAKDTLTKTGSGYNMAPADLELMAREIVASRTATNPNRPAPQPGPPRAPVSPGALNAPYYAAPVAPIAPAARQLTPGFVPQQRQVPPPRQPTPQQQGAGGAAPPGVNRDAAIAEARKALALGRDRNQVINRLRSAGIDPAGL